MNKSLLEKFSAQAFKNHFPLFSVKENQSLVYFDNAATTQKPQVVIDAVAHFYSTSNGNANRSGHRLGREATKIIQVARKKTAKFIAAKTKKEIVFTSGATESINIIAGGLSHLLNEQDEVLISVAEHHANLVPWQEIVNKAKAKLVLIPQDLSGWEQFCNNKTKILSISAASNSLGKITDLSYIKKIKNEFPDIIIVVDASQFVAHKEINVIDIGCDFCVFSAHKMYGPSGLGILYGKEEILSLLKPMKFGGEMVDQVGEYKSNYISGPERFEAGTSPLASIAGFGACLDFWFQLDRKLMSQYEQELFFYLYDRLAALNLNKKYFTILSERENNIGVASIASDYFSLADMAYYLDERDIAVRVGDHCAQPLWRSIDVNSALRISLSAYNTFGDIDNLIATLIEFIDDSVSVERVEQGSLSWLNSKELKSLGTWQKKYKKIIEWSKSYHIKENIRFDKNEVKGCEARLWLSIHKENNTIEVLVDSDSDIIKGLTLIIVDKVNSSLPDAINSKALKGYLIDLGLEKFLSESRINGLSTFIDKVVASIE